jgi:hypothetical protein
VTSKNYEFNKFLEIRYPHDYKAGMLMKSMRMKMPQSDNSLFDVEASMKFDSPFIFFEMGLFD